jgi:hypothetical protein
VLSQATVKLKSVLGAVRFLWKTDAWGIATDDSDIFEHQGD